MNELLLRTARALRRFADVLFVGPIREGRLKDTGWPAGLGSIVVCATVGFGIAVGIVIASPTLREWLPLSVSSGAVTLSLPRALLPLFFSLIVFSIAMLQTAALHTRLRVTVPITIVTGAVLLFLGGLDSFDLVDGVPVSAGKLVSVLAVLGVVLMVVLRRRRTFIWWEFVALTAVLGVTAVVAISRAAANNAAFGIDFGPTTASLIMSSLGSLAVPAAVAAGVAVAELAVTASLAVVALFRPRRAAGEHRSLLRTPLLWFFLTLAVVCSVQIVARYLSGDAAPSLGAFAGSALLMTAIAVGVIAVSRVRRPRDASGRPPAGVTTTELRDRLGGILFPVAAALTAILGPLTVLLLLAQVFYSWNAGEGSVSLVLALVTVGGFALVNTVLRTLAAIAFLVIAVVGARRGWRGAPELLVGFGAIVLITSVPQLFGWSLDWSSDAIAILVTVATFVIAIALVATRRFGEPTLAALAAALVLAEALAWREILANPLSALLGASAIAVILLGFVWNFLTGAGPTREGSAHYPVAVRILLFLANNLFGVTILAFAALARDLDAAIDLDKFSGIGDDVLGTAFVLVIAIALWSGVWRRLPARDAR